MIVADTEPVLGGGRRGQAPHIHTHFDPPLQSLKITGVVASGKSLIDMLMCYDARAMGKRAIIVQDRTSLVLLIVSTSEVMATPCILAQQFTTIAVMEYTIQFPRRYIFLFSVICCEFQLDRNSKNCEFSLLSIEHRHLDYYQGYLTKTSNVCF